MLTSKCSTGCSPASGQPCSNTTLERCTWSLFSGSLIIASYWLGSSAGAMVVTAPIALNRRVTFSDAGAVKGTAIRYQPFLYLRGLTKSRLSLKVWRSSHSSSPKISRLHTSSYRSFSPPLSQNTKVYSSPGSRVISVRMVLQSYCQLPSCQASVVLPSKPFTSVMAATPVGTVASIRH